MLCTRRRLVTMALATIAAGHMVRAAPGRESIAAHAGAPTFNDDIAPIIERRCITCHRPGQPVPMTLRSMAEVRPWLARIRTAVESRRMPPWTADPRFGRFANDTSLSDAELETIRHWIDAGAPEGAGPAVRITASDRAWAHPSGRAPDVVVELPGAIAIPASTQWPTFSLYSRLPAALAAADHFVEAVQLLPGNRRVAHHASLSMRRFPPGVAIGRAQPWPGGPLLDGLPVLVDRAVFERAEEPIPSAAGAFSSAGVAHLTYYFPGNDGFVWYPAAAGKRVRAGDLLEWSLHYTPTGAPEEDRPVAGFWLRGSPPAHEVITLRIGDFHIVNGEEIVLPEGVRTNPGHAAIVDVASTCDGRPCTRPVSMLPPIPAGAGNWRVTGISPVLDDLTIYSLSPHGHLRLTDMTYVVTYPDGHESTALSVPRYDFNWQFVYRLADPLRVPAGSTIKVVAHYDNSPANRLNPDPARSVQWSEQSTDEMFNGFVDLSIDRFGVDAVSTAAVAPKHRLVVAAGCATRDTAGHWSLVRATSPARSAVLHADRAEVTSVRRTADDNRYRLLGSADFASTGDLLETGERALFTTAARANTTGVLAEGRSVAVKGMLVGGEEPAINLVSAWPVPGVCGVR